MASAKFLSTLSSLKVMYAAIIGNFLIVMIKCSAAGWTGSSAMLSEAIHSTVDTANGLLVLYGLNEAKKRPDRIHPLGYGRAVYLWSFVVAILIFALGAGVTIYKGIQHVLNPEPIENVEINYIVLALSALFDGFTWWLALKNFKGKNRNLGLFAAVRKSKDPPSFIVLLEDSAALVGLFIAFIGILLSVSFALPILDGVSSILIGLVLAVTASLLARETKSLLIGEAADPSLVNSITRLSEKIKGISHANGILAIHLAPQQVVIALSLEFADELRTPEIEAKVTELERLVCQSHPEVVTIFVKPRLPQDSGKRKDTATAIGRYSDFFATTSVRCEDVGEDGQLSSSILFRSGLSRTRTHLAGAFCAIKDKALSDAATQSPAPTIAATPNADIRAGPVEARTAPMRAVATRPPVRAMALLSPEAAPV